MKKILATVIIVFIAFVFSKGVLIYTGNVHREFTQCFSVDSNDNLYIAHRGIIDVYSNEGLLRTISPRTSRDYFIFIENDEIFVGHASGKVMVYDLSGNYIRDENSAAQTFNNKVFKKGTKEFNGNSYSINKYWGFKPYVVTCNGELVYIQSTLDFIYNGLPYYLLFVMCFFCGLILIPWVILDKNSSIYKFFH